MRSLLILVQLIFCISLFSQKDKGYKIEIKGHYQVNESLFDDGFVDIYNVFPSDTSELPKYLVYVIRNDLEGKVSNESLLNRETQVELTQDLNGKILESHKASYAGLTGVELKVDYSNQDLLITGCVFMTVVKDSLYRVLVMIPTQEYYQKYYSEFKDLVESFRLT